jgi:hypothetical protein
MRRKVRCYQYVVIRLDLSERNRVEELLQRIIDIELGLLNNLHEAAEKLGGLGERKHVLDLELAQHRVLHWRVLGEKVDERGRHGE